MNEFITIAAIVTFAFQILFVVNFFYSMYKGKKHNRNESLESYFFRVDCTRRLWTMVTGKEKFLKYTVGPMTLVVMAENFIPQTEPLAER